MRIGGSVSFILTVIALGILLIGQLSPGFISASAQASPTLVLTSHTFYPNDIVEFYVYGAASPIMSVTDPSGSWTMVDMTTINRTAYYGTYTLDSGIILDYYTVSVLDTSSGVTVEDRFLVTSKTVPVIDGVNKPGTDAGCMGLTLSGSSFEPGDSAWIRVVCTAGKPEVTVVDPSERSIGVKMEPSGNGVYTGRYDLTEAVVIGEYTVLATINDKGTYSRTSATFNVTYRGLASGLEIDYVAYDPVNNILIIRAMVSDDLLLNDGKAIKARPEFSALGVQKVKPIPLRTKKNGHGISNAVEIMVPVTMDNLDNLSAAYGIDKRITSARTSVSTLNETMIRVGLNDKLDGSWYRLMVDIPDGYRVSSIVRDDGVRIINNYSIDVQTGMVFEEDVNWYVENGTLYFYDDPINGYNVTIQPPVARQSIATEVIEAGQVSALVYPFNQTDSDLNIAFNDHFGRTGDNLFGANLNEQAGIKTAMRIYQNNNPNQMTIYTNNGDYGTLYLDLTKTTVGFNALPNGETESVIISTYSTPATSTIRINVTQKTIIRNNNQWIATVYYLNNTDPYLDAENFRFFVIGNFNFHGDNKQNAYTYNATHHSIYGFYRKTSSLEIINVGGFESSIDPNQYEGDKYRDVWGHIRNGNLANYTAPNPQWGQDKVGALDWTFTPLRRGEVVTVPVIWFVYGDNVEDMYHPGFLNNITYICDNKVYDVGIVNILNPRDGSFIDRITTPIVNINVTSMDNGVTDESARLFVDVRYPNGTLCYTNNTYVNFTIPYQEQVNSTFAWDIRNCPTGTYNISTYIKLERNGVNYDQNLTNNFKRIYVTLNDFAVYPDQSRHVDFGDNVFYNLNLSNAYSAARTFDLNLTRATAGWPTYLFLGDTTNMMAYDSNGDGRWDWVSLPYDSNGNGVPDLPVAGGSETGLILEKLVPLTAEHGIIDNTELTANVIGFIPRSSALLRTYTPLPDMANKTYYLHPLYMKPFAYSNTSLNYTALTKYAYTFWSQKNPMSTDFSITGNFTVSLYINSTSTSLPLTVTVFYTDGSFSGNIGSNMSVLATSTMPQLYQFTIEPDEGQVTIPRDYYIVLKIDNMDAKYACVFHNTNYRSRVDLNTTTVISVNSVIAYGGSGPQTYFYGGDTLKVVANVSDPLGSEDITGADFTLYAPNETPVVHINVPMPVNGTDPRDPSLWKTFNYYPLVLNDTLPIGRYNLSVTGLESNGITDTRNLTIYIISNRPGVHIFPNTTRFGDANTNVSIRHTIINLNSGQGDTIDLSCNDTRAWPVWLYAADGVTPLTDTNGNGMPDTGSLSPLGSIDIVVKTYIPIYATVGDMDVINVTVNSSLDTDVSSMATDRVIFANEPIIKTLYLHPSEGSAAAAAWPPSPLPQPIWPMSSPKPQTLNTSVYMGAERSYTLTQPNSYISWSQELPYAKDFYALESVNVTLYMSQSQAGGRLRAYLYSTDGTNPQTLMGWAEYQLDSITNTVRPISFQIQTGENTTIPRGKGLQVYLVNVGSSPNTLTIYMSGTRNSRLDLWTNSYIQVNDVSVYDMLGSLTDEARVSSSFLVTTNVSDPFGSYDIRNVTVSIYYENGTLALAPQWMSLTSTDTGYPSMFKRFEKQIDLPDSFDIGKCYVQVTANETNMVKGMNSTAITIRDPYIDVTASKTITSLGGNDFLVTIAVKNNNNARSRGIVVYDLYTADFTVSGFSFNRTVVPVTWAGGGYLNRFDPLTLNGKATFTITYHMSGTGLYKLPDTMVVGVDPVV